MLRQWRRSGDRRPQEVHDPRIDTLAVLTGAMRGFTRSRRAPSPPRSRVGNGLGRGRISRDHGSVKLLAEKLLVSGGAATPTGVTASRAARSAAWSARWPSALWKEIR